MTVVTLWALCKCRPCSSGTGCIWLQPVAARGTEAVFFPAVLHPCLTGARWPRAESAWPGLCDPLTWAGHRALQKVHSVGKEGVLWPLAAAPEQTEPCRAAPPSSCPVTSAQWMQCVPAASTASVAVARAGTLCSLISLLLPPSPEGLFSSRLSSKRARDTAGKQPGTKQTASV